MKRFVVFLTLAACAVILKAQDEQADMQSPDEMRTLFGPNIKHGGYGAFSTGYTSIADRDVALIGGRAAWVLNHSLGIGFGGNGFVSTMEYDKALDSDANISGGYGGFLIEPILFPRFPVHIALPVLVGAGGVAYAKRQAYMHNHNNDDYDFTAEDASPFFFIKPGVELEMNLIRFVRFSVGAYYMQTGNVSLYNFKNDMLNGFSGMMTIKIGLF